jgi:hypothetical protein
MLSGMTMKPTGGGMNVKRKKANPWITFVKKVAKEKGIKYNEALKIASKTYKK